MGAFEENYEKLYEKDFIDYGDGTFVPSDNEKDKEGHDVYHVSAKVTEDCKVVKFTCVGNKKTWKGFKTFLRTCPFEELKAAVTEELQQVLSDIDIAYNSNLEVSKEFFYTSFLPELKELGISFEENVQDNYEDTDLIPVRRGKELSEEEFVALVGDRFEFDVWQDSIEVYDTLTGTTFLDTSMWDI